VARRSNPAGEWAISRAVAHPPLVSEAEFVAAQQVRAARPAKDGRSRRYLLAGLVECRLCGRRMDSIGCMAGLGIAVVTATPVAALGHRCGRRVSTCVRTSC
jgi:hypothetical protein